ncbi:MAG: aminotransferase class I/II-fold pyridoxal phosphate-dependent enzyme [Myxococcota bacterium]|nr:aminotransferase class I/II-fold pyridoxal phosphate-dependent enzyme [Myxococcales bacterium]
MDHSAQLALIESHIDSGVQRGLGHLVLEDERLDGRFVTIDGERRLNFGSCSYLGLELDERLKRASIDAVERYGTQISSSRTYVSSPQYLELEHLLERIFDAHVVTTATTTLAHFSAFPVLIGGRDVVLLDQSVHASVQLTSSMLRSGGTRIETVRHSDLAMLEERVEALSRECDRVWYLADGVYSMAGDTAPIGALQALLDRHPQLHLYVDDAHGMSWRGRHGRGVALEKYALHPRMVVTTSLSKSFAGGGAAIVVPDPQLARRLRLLGPSLIFGGPMQPALLGAAIASARIHLSPEIESLQADLQARLELCNDRLASAGIPLASSQRTPVRFVACGPVRVAYALGQRLTREGFHVNAVGFPAVSTRRTGIRFTLTRHLEPGDIEALVDAIDRHFEAAFRETGDSPTEVFADFRLPETHRFATSGTATPRAAARARHVELACAATIADVPEVTWNQCFGGRGAFDVAGQRFAERLLGREAAGPNASTFRYYRGVDARGRTVVAAPFSCFRWKVDVDADEAVSRVVEERRREDPEYLTVRAFAAGTLLSEGDHLFLDRESGDEWRDGLARMLEAVRRDARALEAEMIVLRDLPADDDELRAFLEGEGFVAREGPTSHAVEIAWRTEEEFLAGLTPKSRYAQRRQVMPFDAHYEREIVGKGTRRLRDDEHAHLWDLYCQVKRRSLAFNTFDLPDDVFRLAEADPSWELTLLHPREELAGGGVEGRDLPCAVGACFVGRGVYVPTVLGMDDRYARTAGLYRQMLRHALLRAAELGLPRVHLGYGSDLEKRRFGAVARRSTMYVLADDTYAFEALAQIEANLGR